MPVGAPAWPTVVMPVRIGKLAGDEVGAARRAARLGVIIGKQHAFGGELVEVRRPPGHHAAVVGPDIPHADVVPHDDDDVRPLAGRSRCRRRWLLLRLCRGCQSDSREAPKRRRANCRLSKRSRRFNPAVVGSVLASGLFGTLSLLMT